MFARALETPGGLKIQTIHAFCEKLLRRFPLEAGVSPRFTVLENEAALALSREAREDLALAAFRDPEGLIGRAYSHFAVELHWDGFQSLLAMIESDRAKLLVYIDGVEAGQMPGPHALTGADPDSSPDSTRLNGGAWPRPWPRARPMTRNWPPPCARPARPAAPSPRSAASS